MSRIELGYISGFHGIGGWVKVFSYTDPKENILNYPNWLLCHQGNWVPFKLENSKLTPRSVVAKLASLDDRTTAEKYIKARIAIEEQDLPVLSSDEYYWRDMLGLTVVNTTGQTLGQLKSIMQTGANDVLEIIGDNQRYLIPYTIGTHVIKVDIQNALITVDWDLSDDDSV